MPVYDERNILHIGPPQRPGDAEVTRAMADAVRARIRDASGTLPVWAVLHEDRYDSPAYSDHADEDDDNDMGLSLCGLALNSVDAERLAAVHSVYWIRTNAWCNPPTCGTRLMAPARCKGRPSGASLRRARCVRMVL